jgi:hypothetical protein
MIPVSDPIIDPFLMRFYAFLVVFLQIKSPAIIAVSQAI